MNAPAPTELRETIARIIDPSAWSVHDAKQTDYLAAKLTAPSLTKADAIIALRQAASVGAEVAKQELASVLAALTNIADTYDDRKDDSFQIFKDCDQEPIRLLTLGICRAARSVRAALASPSRSEGGQTTLPDTELELLAGKLAGAELNYRNAYERFGDGHIETGRKWDKMRRAGDAIREYKFQSEREPADPAQASWMPIETAPLDGTAVFIAEEPRASLGEAYYDAEENRWYWANTGRGDYPDPPQPFPTHWMSLPSGPSVPSAPAQAAQQPVAWTNEHQLGYLKDLTYAQVPMAMWASRSDSSPIPLYASPVSSASRGTEA